MCTVKVGNNFVFLILITGKRWSKKSLKVVEFFVLWSFEPWYFICVRYNELWLKSMSIQIFLQGLNLACCGVLCVLTTSCVILNLPGKKIVRNLLLKHRQTHSRDIHTAIFNLIILRWSLGIWLIGTIYLYKNLDQKK